MYVYKSGHLIQDKDKRVLTIVTNWNWNLSNNLYVYIYFLNRYVENIHFYSIFVSTLNVGITREVGNLSLTLKFTWSYGVKVMGKKMINKIERERL